jgi:hypothetical protein
MQIQRFDALLQGLGCSKRAMGPTFYSILDCQKCSGGLGGAFDDEEKTKDLEAQRRYCQVAI